MPTNLDSALEASGWPVDLAGGVRALIASLQPGEVLSYGEDDGLAFYARCAGELTPAPPWCNPARRILDLCWLDGGVGIETVSAVIHPEVVAAVARGDLLDGLACSEWIKPPG